MELSQLASPTRLAWAPDGRLLVADLRGRITALRYDQNWNETERTELASLVGSESDAILGMAVDPADGTIYIAHSKLQAGGCEDLPWLFRGQISALRAPGYEALEAIVTGLPNGKTSHGVNDLIVLPNGDLLVSIGGVTNAGIPHCNFGSIPESPLSASVLRIRLSASDFEGSVSYEFITGPESTEDQRHGASIRVVDGSWGRIEATGFRNAFGMEMTNTGHVYVLDNGPNPGGGMVLTGEGAMPIEEHPDELNLMQANGYYGHPNPSRGEMMYYSSLAESSPEYVQALRTLPASTNGIVHFESEIPGFENVLILQQFNGKSFALDLDVAGLPTGEPRVFSDDFGCLDIIRGPGGTLFGTDFTHGRILMARIGS